MLSLTPIIKLIEPKPQGFNQLWFRQVAGAAEYAQIRPDALPLPAAWVVRANEKSKHLGERREEITITFDVVIAIENARVHTAGETDDALLDYRKAVKNKLLGAYADDDTKAINYDGGRVLQYAEGDIYWADTYSFVAQITNYLPDPPPYESADYQENLT